MKRIYRHALSDVDRVEATNRVGPFVGLLGRVS